MLSSRCMFVTTRGTTYNSNSGLGICGVYVNSSITKMKTWWMTLYPINNYFRQFDSKNEVKILPTKSSDTELECIAPQSWKRLFSLFEPFHPQWMSLRRRHDSQTQIQVSIIFTMSLCKCKPCRIQLKHRCPTEKSNCGDIKAHIYTLEFQSRRQPSIIFQHHAQGQLQCTFFFHYNLISSWEQRRRLTT